MNTQLTVPQTIAIGQVKRPDTYTGRLGYVIYKDEKGKLRKETSWEGWRDKTIEPIFTENKPTEGFVLNKNGGGNSHSRYSDYYSRAAFIRVYDPRDFEFEISVENLLFILRYCDCSRGKGLEGKFVYAWHGKDLVLLPEGCEEYKNSVEFTKLKELKVSTKELIPGYTYHTKDQENLLYLGKFNYRQDHWRNGVFYDPEHIFYRVTQTLEEYINGQGHTTEYWLQQEIQYAAYYEQYSSNTDRWSMERAPEYTPEKFQKYKLNTYNNDVEFYNKQKFLNLKPIKIAKLVDSTIHPDFAHIINELESSGIILIENGIRIEKSPVKINASNNNSWYDGNVMASRYLKIYDGKYKQVDIIIRSSTNPNFSYNHYSGYKNNLNEPQYILHGFFIKDTFNITYDGVRLKKTKISTKKSDILIKPEALNEIEFFEFKVLKNNIEEAIY